MKPLAMRSVVRVAVVAAAAAAFLLFAASAGQAGRGTIVAPCCFDYGTIDAASTSNADRTAALSLSRINYQAR